MKATEVTAGLAESNGSLLPGLWRDSLHVTCGLTACTPGSAPGPTLGNEYGKTLPFYWSSARDIRIVSTQRTAEVLETSQDGNPLTGVIKSYNSHGCTSGFTHSQHKHQLTAHTVHHKQCAIPPGYFGVRSIAITVTVYTVYTVIVFLCDHILRTRGPIYNMFCSVL